VGVDVEARIAVLEARLELAVADNERLRSENERLRARVAELESRLGKNSTNSSMPPSRDDATARGERAKRASQRPKSNRKPGGQRGRRGNTMRRVDDPDRTVEHHPVACEGCGATLEGAVEHHPRQRRQVFDIVARPVEVTEHQTVTCRCACGHDTTGSFPPEATGPAVWGPKTAALAVSLVIRQHIPYQRAAEILAGIGAAVSVGWIVTQVQRAATLLAGWLAHLRARLHAVAVLHADETSARVAGATWWFHVASTSLLTLLVAHRNRGQTAVDDAGVLANMSGTLIHDRAAMYWNYAGNRHGLCVAHLCRDLAGIATHRRHQGWAEALRSVLYEAKKTCDAARQRGDPALSEDELEAITAGYSVALGAALETCDPCVHPDANTKGIHRNAQHEILAFTRNLQIPFDNNQAERDLPRRGCGEHPPIGAEGARHQPRLHRRPDGPRLAPGRLDVPEVRRRRRPHGLLPVRRDLHGDHRVPVLARILQEAGLSRTPVGVLALTCAAVDDVVAWCLLVVVATMVDSSGASPVATAAERSGHRRTRQGHGTRAGVSVVRSSVKS
jgi:transposase